MSNSAGLKLFISYSHKDEKHIDKFRKHLAPLKNKGTIQDWYDRKILPGEEFENKIDNNLYDANIIILSISASFLNSDNCMKEKYKALELKKAKRIPVVPIILSPCGWKDDDDISKLLVLPTDGNAVTNYATSDHAWHNVYEGLKELLEAEALIRTLKFSDTFSKFLRDTDLLTKAHAQKENVYLDDIFVWPELSKYDVLRDYERLIKSETIFDDQTDNIRIVIAGENQSGKTALCKKLVIKLREELRYVPVYVSDESGQFAGKIENRVKKSFSEQYVGLDFNQIDKVLIIPIIDNFHHAKHKERHIDALKSYTNSILIVDDIFSLNLEDERLTELYNHYCINQFKPTYRYKLIKKWVEISEHNMGSSSLISNSVYKHIDEKTELVNSALGKIIGAGIMPSYPFFILSVLSHSETLGKPLNQEITSQGYCYQALIYIYLRKESVRNEDIDTYLNFLSEFAFHCFKEKKRELSASEFSSYLIEYKSRFNLHIPETILLRNLNSTNIIHIDSFYNYSFKYLYLYYFFVAKYLSEHINENMDKIKKIIANLHTDENAYIAVFISHHSKETSFLEELVRNSMCLFEEYKPATLFSDELTFFDDQLGFVVEAILPTDSSSPESERIKRLEIEDELEETRRDNESNSKGESTEYDQLARELRRCVKTVEVLGRIVKNRAGSLEIPRLKVFFEEAMNTLLRLLTSFFNLIQQAEAQHLIIDYINEKVDKYFQERSKLRQSPVDYNPTKEQIERLSERFFWNTNFMIVYGIINKIIHSLGSDKLLSVVNKVCDSTNTPASFLIKHGILMWYNKNLRIEEITTELDEESFSKIAKHVMKMLVANHCAMHSVSYKDKQRIEQQLDIPIKHMLASKMKRGASQ